MTLRLILCSTPLGLLASEGFAASNSERGNLDLARLLVNEVELNVEFFRHFSGPYDALCSSNKSQTYYIIPTRSTIMRLLPYPW